ncbi:MAG: hypothetical protein LBQ06_07530 [Frankiaceae bacterium]|nr:hypothetical protein [Frankiaceae bacterium]
MRLTLTEEERVHWTLAEPLANIVNTRDITDLTGKDALREQADLAGVGSSRRQTWVLPRRQSSNAVSSVNNILGLACGCKHPHVSTCVDVRPKGLEPLTS